MTKQKKITEKNKEFCRNYLQTGNATVSYLEAYGGGYQTASVNASVLLRNTKIQDYIQELRDIEEAERILQIRKLKEQNIESIQGNLLLSKILRDICISKAKESRNTQSRYDLSESWLNAIARAAEASSRLDKAAREGFIVLSGLEKLAEEMANKDD
ncbi:terminase small subunit [Crocosphaera sp. Alani8]|uniref:terminase small subunit n=1 Tax=Crocosphaera sp. Alani8 TaxID=3038952 RepID=UPI00313E3E7A